MKRVLFIVLILSIFLLACSKGNMITGTTVLDLEELNKPVEAVSGDAKEEVTEDAAKEEDSKEAADDEPPTYEDSKGTCTEDSLGTVRAISEEGKKEVYRNSCLGGILVDHSCDGNKVVTKNERCSRGCEIVNYVGQCK